MCQDVESCWLSFFFCKQKTACELGLGIPAEPLFRSLTVPRLTLMSIILIKLIRVSLGTVRHPRRFKIVVIDIQITLKIGRASCREREKIPEVAGDVKQKHKEEQSRLRRSHMWRDNVL